MHTNTKINWDYMCKWWTIKWISCAAHLHLCLHTDLHTDLHVLTRANWYVLHIFSCILLFSFIILNTRCMWDIYSKEWQKQFVGECLVCSEYYLITTKPIQHLLHIVSILRGMKCNEELTFCLFVMKTTSWFSHFSKIWWIYKYATHIRNAVRTTRWPTLSKSRNNVWFWFVLKR